VFEPGNTYAKGGKRQGAGRPKAKQIEIEKTAQQLAREIIEQNCGRIMGAYMSLATSGTDPQTTRHAVDKLLPEIKLGENQRPIAIQVVIEQGTNGNGAHADIEGEGRGWPVLIGGE
jgi:hypothetical protein